MIWQPEFTDKTLSRKPGAVHPVCMPLITHLLNVEELSRLLKNVALSVINLFILDDVSEKMEYIPDWVVVTRLNIWWR
ncbi:putative integrase [Escherichia coli]|nr:putative integrase [Escherichia coli]